MDDIQLYYFSIQIPKSSITKARLRAKLTRFRNHLVSTMDDFDIEGDVTYTDDWGQDQHILSFEFKLTEKPTRQFTVDEIKQRFGSRIKTWIGNERISGVKVIRHNEVDRSDTEL